MQFPENGVKIPEEQKEITFKWDDFVVGMQPYINYRYYFRLTGGTVTIEKHLLKFNSVTIAIKDLAGAFGLSEGNQYNWEVRAVQHVEGDDRIYYGTVDNITAQNGTRAQIISQNSYFFIVPASSKTVVPFAVEPESPLYGLEPIKASTNPVTQEKNVSVIPTTTTEGSQVKTETPKPAETKKETTDYTPIVIGVAAIIAIFFFID